MVKARRREGEARKASEVWGCWNDKKEAWLCTTEGFVFHSAHRGVAVATSKMAVKWYGRELEVRLILPDGTPGPKEKGTKTKAPAKKRGNTGPR